MNEHVALRLPPTEYESDFYAWAYRQAQFIRDGRFDNLDIVNVAEEIEALARTDKATIVSCMAVVIEYLLKLMCSPATDPRHGWEVSSVNARNKIELTWDGSPSLRCQQRELFSKAWKYGVRAARLGMEREPDGLARLAEFEKSLPFTVEQALDHDFMPGDDVRSQ